MWVIGADSKPNGKLTDKMIVTPGFKEVGLTFVNSLNKLFQNNNKLF